VKRWPIVIGAFVIVNMLALLVISNVFVTYALCERNLEMLFHVTDAGTGEPIPDASVRLFTADFDSEGRRLLACIITDSDGNAQYFREDNRCEDVIRPLRKTITFIDLTWALVDVAAAGYSIQERIWLEMHPYDETAFFPERHTHRLLFNIPLSTKTESK
jgi:hypothetical protein